MEEQIQVDGADSLALLEMAQSLATDLVEANMLTDLERSEAEQMMAGKIRRHQLPPAALGSRRSSLLHKLHAFFHAYYNETCSWAALGGLMQTVVSVTTDAGTESGFAAAGLLDLPLFSHLCGSLTAKAKAWQSTSGWAQRCK